MGTAHLPLRSHRSESGGISRVRRSPPQTDCGWQSDEPATHHGTTSSLSSTKTTSEDEGDSYSPMENIDAKVGAAHTTYVGVGHGLQLHYGPHAGRLVSFLSFPHLSCSSATTTATNTIPSGSPTTRAFPGRRARRCCVRWTRRSWWRWETAM